MRIMNANALSGFVRKTSESASDFATVVHNLILDIRDSYRPELHYMRGPGPKWRAKHPSSFLGVGPHPQPRPGSTSC